MTKISTPSGEIDATKIKNMPTRAYRDAWRVNGDVIDFDMDAARDIHRAKISEATKEELKELDERATILTRRLLFSDAPSKADKDALRDIENRAQELRDAVNDPAIDEAGTVAELERVWPI